MGVPKKWSIIDVYGLDPDLLAIVPRPVLAVILLYPTKVCILYKKKSLMRYKLCNRQHYAKKTMFVLIYFRLKRLKKKRKNQKIARMILQILFTI